jgi:hypothetical protein
MNAQPIPLRRWLRSQRISATAQLTDPTEADMADEWKARADIWRVTLRRRAAVEEPLRTRPQLTVRFYMGPALAREPKAEDVLDSLASDANGYENARSFEEWASEYGYDPDSRTAERLYREVERQTERLRRFLSPRQFEQLVNGDVERL